jgi:predicted dehydrogenase
MHNSPLRVAVIGTGRPWKSPGHTGFGMAHPHARAYRSTGQCQLVAACDVVRERAEQFVVEHAMDGPEKTAVYTDHETMLAEVKPDMVSVCVWPDLHAPLTIAAAEAGVRAIHCEKPMAPTWGEARRMAEVCRARGVQLTFNHQRRFLAPFQRARQLVKDGAIGTLRRMEGACGDLFDWGTHWLDMFGYYNDDTAGEWVIGQVDARAPKTVFGVPTETQGLCQVRYKNGVTGVLFTGHGANETLGDCANRLIGDDGVIEVLWDKPHLRLRGKGDAAPRTFGDLSEGIHGDAAIDRAVADAVSSLREGKTPLLAADNALKVTEIIFATYESARRRGRVDLPLAVDDSPFAALLAAGAFPEAVAQGPVRDTVLGG